MLLVNKDLTKRGFEKFSPELERNIFIILRERERTTNIYEYNLKVQIVLCHRCCYYFIFFILTQNSFLRKTNNSDRIYL